MTHLTKDGDTNFTVKISISILADHDTDADRDQDQQNAFPELDPNCLTLW